MKVYDIFDKELQSSVGTLLYYEKEKAFIIELEEWLDEWTAPLHFSGLVKRGVYTILQEESGLWVKARIIPPGRQNIQSILANHRLKEYSEIAFLEISKGECSQDAICIRPREDLPEYVEARSLYNIKEAVICNDEILLFFNDDSVKKIKTESLADSDHSLRHLKNPDFFRTCVVGVGGHSLSFGGVLEIPASVLYHWEKTENITLSDFCCFVQNNVLDTTEAGGLIECSRQNLAYLVEQNRLPVIKPNVKGNLYLKGDVLKTKW